MKWVFKYFTKYVFNYTKTYLNMICFLFFVSTFIFLDWGIFGDIISFNVCHKHGFFKSCFQQNAKGKMTALNVR